MAPVSPAGHAADNGGTREKAWRCFRGSLISERHVSSPWEQSLGRPGGGERCGCGFPIRLCLWGWQPLKRKRRRKERGAGEWGGPLLALLTPRPPRTNPAGPRAEQVGRQLGLLLNSCPQPVQDRTACRCDPPLPLVVTQETSGHIWADSSLPGLQNEADRVYDTGAGPSQGWVTPRACWARAFSSLEISGSQVCLN